MQTDQQIHAAAAEAVSPGSRVTDVKPYRRHPSPFPAKLTLTTAAGPLECVVKTAPAHSSRLSVEAAALRIMHQAGAHAPRLLVGPTLTDTNSGPIEFVVMTPIPGQLLPWLNIPDIATGDQTCRHWIEAVDQLHALTARIEELPEGRVLARKTLDAELADTLASDGPWTATRLFDRSVDLINDHIAAHRFPLAFSNGDYNPLNLLVDGEDANWIDFEYAAFEDPLIGMPKFWFWADDSGWVSGSQLGLIERYLYRHRICAEAFAVRILLRGLTHLRDTTPDNPPTQMIATMERAIDTLHHA